MKSVFACTWKIFMMGVSLTYLYYFLWAIVATFDIAAMPDVPTSWLALGFGRAAFTVFEMTLKED